jgi:hypothetical protein
MTLVVNDPLNSRMVSYVVAYDAPQGNQNSKRD